MVSHNGALIFKARDEAALAGLAVAKTQMHGQEVFVCRHSWRNVSALRERGFKAPGVPVGPWAYTGRFTPMKHQRETVEFLVRNPRAFVLSDMGTGKTGSAIWAAEHLLQKDVIRRVLILCPLSVLHVWTDELFNIAPHRTHVTLYGSKAKRLQLLAEGTTYCIINHDGVATIKDELKKGGFDLVILDEASAYRNAGTTRYKVFRELCRLIKMLWPLTGTPAPTAPTDVWALIKLVDPQGLAMSFGAFKELTMRKVSQFVWVPRQDSSETIYKLMKPAIRFRKEDCLDLPPLTYVSRECTLSDEQRKAFEQMRKTMALEKKEGGEKITAANAAVAIQKLMQVCCGVVKDNDGEVHQLDDAPRLKLLQEVIEEAGGKAIVFIPFIGVMQRVKEFLDAAKISAEVVNGTVSQGAREAIFSQFQHGSLSVLIAHPKTAAHGLTLTASSCIIWYGPIFSAELWQQGNARIHRPGQTRACTVVSLGASSLEWKLYEALNGKIKLQDAILREYEALIK